MGFFYSKQTLWIYDLNHDLFTFYKMSHEMCESRAYLWTNIPQTNYEVLVEVVYGYLFTDDWSLENSVKWV